MLSLSAHRPRRHRKPRTHSSRTTFMERSLRTPATNRVRASATKRRTSMGNIQIKKNGPQQSAAMTPAQTTADPSRWFSRLMGFDPFREMAPFFTEEEQRMTFAPAFEVK